MAKKNKKVQNPFAEKSLKERFTEATSAKAFRLGGYSAVSIIIVVIIAVIINLALGELPSSLTKLDLSTDKLSTVSQQTKENVSALEKDVTVYWIVQEGSEDAYIEQLLDRYTDLSKHLKVEKRDPVVNPNFASQYTTEQIYNNSLIVVSGEKSQYISYYEIYVTDYTNYYTTGQTTTQFYGESCVTAAVEYVTSEDLPTMYILDGHGSASMDATLLNLIGKQNIDTTGLNLLTEAEVPADCDLLAIYAPETDLSKPEADAIQAYLGKGGKLLLVTAHSQEAMPNLADVMAYYGVKQGEGVVFEADTASYYQYPYLLLPQINDHTITAPIATGYYVLYPQAQAIEQVEGAAETVTVTPLLTSSDKAFVKLDVSNMKTYEKEEGDIEGQYDLAVAIEDSATNAQIVWFTGTQFTLSDYDEAVGGTNHDLFLNALSWMCKSESSITIHAKTISNEYLTMSASARAILTLVMIAILPLAFVVVGIYVAISRRKR